MMKMGSTFFLRLFLSLWLALAASSSWSATPVQTHGALAVKGNQIVDKTGHPVAFSGPSFFWSNTGMQQEKYYDAAMVRYYRREWNATVVRAALGVDPKGGYLDDPQGNQRRVFAVVDAAIAEGLYVIVDWHSHHAEDHPDAAIRFFQGVARKYGKHPNIIYEIYNEPLREAGWSSVVKPYAEKVVAAIRAIDPDNLIIVGTPAWSQDVDVAAADPLNDFRNIAYSLHFYAGTHKQALRDKAQVALDKGIALMVTEWGTVNADGDGGVDRDETLKWFAFMKQHHLTNCNWAVSDKAEGASHFKPGTPADGKIDDDRLTPSGLFVKELVRHWDDTAAR